MEILAIIPARGGSKSIHKKNIYPICGKPLLAYSIETALGAKHITRTIVTTDDEEIAEVAKKYGADLPFMRPVKYAEDDTPDLPVFLHALKWLEENKGYIPNIVVHLWPTSPYRESEEIDKAIKLLIDSPKADSVRSVTTPSVLPFKMWGINNNQMYPILKKEFPEIYIKYKEPHAQPRQTLPKTFVQTGYCAAIRRDVIVKDKSMFGKTILPFFHDPNTYTELDSMKDLHNTEYVIKKYSKEK